MSRVLVSILHVNQAYNTHHSVFAQINNEQVTGPSALVPPNSAALLSPTGVRVNESHGGGGCPIISGELHFPESDENT